jgi:hypothetical protein
MAVFILAFLSRRQIASFVRRIILSSVTRLAAYTVFFHIISLTARFSEKVIENKTCVLMYSTTFV